MVDVGLVVGMGYGMDVMVAVEVVVMLVVMIAVEVVVMVVVIILVEGEGVCEDLDRLADRFRRMRYMGGGLVKGHGEGMLGSEMVEFVARDETWVVKRMMTSFTKLGGEGYY